MGIPLITIKDKLDEHFNTMNELQYYCTSVDG